MSESAYVGKVKKFSPNHKNQLFLDFTPEAETPNFIQILGLTNLELQFTDTTVSDTFINNGGAETTIKVGTSSQVLVEGRRDSNDPGQNALFTPERPYATGDDCLVRMRVIGKNLTYEGLAYVFSAAETLGASTDMSPFSFPIMWDGEPTVTVTTPPVEGTSFSLPGVGGENE